MNKPEFYYTIEQGSVAEFKDRGSRFIACAFPIITTESFKIKLQQLKKEHPKAVHHCFAYRIGTDGNQFRSSDDGEPAGAAGKPILGQIDSRGLTNILIVVVRYFGGTLLGVPGLIHAYKSAASLALQTVPAIKKTIMVQLTLQFDYTKMNDVMRTVKQQQGIVQEQQNQLFCRMMVQVPAKEEKTFRNNMEALYGIEIL